MGAEFFFEIIDFDVLHIIGLLLDAIGALLVFIFGVPLFLSNGGGIPIFLIGEGKRVAVKERNFRFWARVGIGFIPIGFSIQLFISLIS